MARRFRFDRGDWVATRNARGEWVMAGKVVDADSESITVEYRGLRSHYAVGEGPIGRVRWLGGGRWAVR